MTRVETFFLPPAILLDKTGMERAQAIERFSNDAIAQSKGQNEIVKSVSAFEMKDGVYLSILYERTRSALA